MTQISQWLSGGDLRSDGVSGEVAKLVLANPPLIQELLPGLNDPDDVVRGRSADALEKVARSRPDLLIESLPKLTHLAEHDPLPFVKMHVAMALGHLAMYEEMLPKIYEALMGMLQDSSVFAKSWAIVSLCIIARLYPHYVQEILQRITSLQQDPSIAIRTKVRYALNLLTNPDFTFPKGWLKSTEINI